MQFFWKCEECDETNLYPDVKVCGTCGTPMSPDAEARVLKEIKEEEKRQEQIRLEEERRQREAERRRKEEEKRRREEARRQQVEAREAKISGVYRRLTRILGICIMALAGLALVFTVVLFVRNADRVQFDGVGRNFKENVLTEYFAHTTPSAVPWEDPPYTGRTSRVIEHVRSEIPPAFKNVLSNVKEGVSSLKEAYTPMENISDLIDWIMEILSGGSADGNV